MKIYRLTKVTKTHVYARWKAYGTDRRGLSVKIPIEKFHKEWIRLPQREIMKRKDYEQKANRVNPPMVTAKIWLVPHGYQLDIEHRLYATKDNNGVSVQSICRDFAGSYDIGKITESTVESISKTMRNLESAYLKSNVDVSMETFTHKGKRLEIRGRCEKCNTLTNWVVDMPGRIGAYWCGCGN